MSTSPPGRRERLRRFACAALLCLLAQPTYPGDAKRPDNLLLNGGFDSTGRWVLSGARLAKSPVPDPDSCLQCTGNTSARQDYFLPRAARYSISCRIRVEGVKPAEPGGHVFAAVYQLDAAGKLLAFKDFVCLQKPSGWTRYAYTFQRLPGAECLSIRLGIYNATGKAFFDDVVLVEGDTPMDAADVDMNPRQRTDARQPLVAVLRDDLPARGAPSSPERMAEVIGAAGFDVEFLNSTQLADPKALNASRVDLVVLPYGPVFPAEAAHNFVLYLRSGGRFLSTGGYAFQEPMLLRDGRRMSAIEAIAEEERTAESNVIPDPGFENDGKSWRSNSPKQASVISTGARTGGKCASVQVTPGAEEGAHPLLTFDFRPTAGRRYRLAGWMRTENVEGHFAYMAVYQYDSKGELAEWHDVMQIRGTTDWHRYVYSFAANAKASRIQIQLGLYRACGEAWFDDVCVIDVTDVPDYRINTADGTPGDGLKTRQDQIGVFDPSFPLRRVASIVAAPGQHVVPPDFRLDCAAEGWAASAVRGYSGTKYVPLLDCVDRYGRPRGPAAAIMHHHGSFFAGSSWGFFGVTNRDLFGDGAGCDRLLAGMVHALLRSAYIRPVSVGSSFYSPGETVRFTAQVHNQGVSEFSGRVHGTVIGRSGRILLDALGPAVHVEPGASGESAFSFPLPAGCEDLYHVACTLIDEAGNASAGGRAVPVDTETSGFVVRSSDLASTGPELTFRDNYFRLDGRPAFLTGTDTYSSVFNSQCHNPATWDGDLRALRDFGLSVYENLQYTPPEYVFSNEQMNQFRALYQLICRHGLIYMPCLLCGHNVAVDDELLARQKKMCRDYAAEFADARRFIFYLNGDLRYDVPNEKDWYVEKWREFLREKYGDVRKLKRAWGESVEADSFDSLPLYTGNASGWGDCRYADRCEFELRMTTRWLSAMGTGVRSAGADQPTTAEFYCIPFGGIDVVSSIGDVEVANIGYFKEPYKDIEELPGTLRWADQRARGKSVNLGEFGVKTHPAWDVDNGARGYHIMRTRQEAAEHFLAVGHYAFGMGASKIQNWCLRDAPEWVFPWGLFHPARMIPKDTAVIYRNMGFLFRLMRPAYRAPELSVLIPDRHRTGSGGGHVFDALRAAMTALVGCHVDFNTLSEFSLNAIPETTRTIWYPVPYCPDDRVVGLLEAFVESGGRLYVSGDFSFDEHRRRSRSERLERLAGVAFAGEHYPNASYWDSQPVPEKEISSAVGLHIDFAVHPGLKLRPAGCRVLADVGGNPLIVEHDVGKGKVLFVNDPVEFRGQENLLRLYSQIMTAWEMKRKAIRPDEAALHVFDQPLADGVCTMVYDTDEARRQRWVEFESGGRRIKMQTRGLLPALVWVDGSGQLLGFESPGAFEIDGRTLKRGDAHAAIVSLDGKDVAESKALVAFPFGTGEIRLDTATAPGMECRVGEFVDAAWREYEKLPPSPTMTVDEDRASALMLLTDGEHDIRAQRLRRWLFDYRSEQ